MKEGFLLVHKSVLPDFLEKVIECREAVDSGKMNVSDACRKYDISRSTYYKYKDLVFLPEDSGGHIAVITLRLKDAKGVLSAVLAIITEYKGNIITISNGVPVKNNAFVNLTMDAKDLTIDVQELVRLMGEIDGVKSAELIAME